jgi:hypothetical protein
MGIVESRTQQIPPRRFFLLEFGEDIEDWRRHRVDEVCVHELQR